MGAVVLNDLRMCVDSRSYIDALHAILTHKRWISCSKPMLAGMTVTGFRFTVNRRLTAESATAYNWMAENFLAADFIGVTAGQASGFQFDPVFPLYQKHAISEIKASIDRGTGAVIWKDGFAVAVGYDDAAESLYYCDGAEEGPKAMNYTGFGVNLSPYWYFQIIEDRVEMDEAAVYKESLVQAVYKWESHDPMLPESDYACGREAYGAIIEALRSGHYDPEGAYEVFRCYAAAKRDVASYTEALQKKGWTQLGETAGCYREVAALFGKVLATIEGNGDVVPLNDPDRTAKNLVPLFIDARQAEEKAIQSVKTLLRETIDNRFHDIGLR
ncbi:hypothetical protein AB6A23_21105 [Paenibacillus tarimensis]